MHARVRACTHASRSAGAMIGAAVDASSWHACVLALATALRKPTAHVLPPVSAPPDARRQQLRQQPGVHHGGRAGWWGFEEVATRGGSIKQALFGGQPALHTQRLCNFSPHTAPATLHPFWQQNNTYGTHVLLEAARKAGTVRRFINVSTDEVRVGGSGPDGAGEQCLQGAGVLLWPLLGMQLRRVELWPCLEKPSTLQRQSRTCTPLCQPLWVRAGVRRDQPGQGRG